MKIVIDTNVVVSAVLKGKKPRELIQFIIDSCDCKWIVSQDILLEYKSVLRRPKFRLSENILREWFDIFDLSTSAQKAYQQREYKTLSEFIAQESKN